MQERGRTTTAFERSMVRNRVLSPAAGAGRYLFHQNQKKQGGECGSGS